MPFSSVTCPKLSDSQSSSFKQATVEYNVTTKKKVDVLHQRQDEIHERFHGKSVQVTLGRLDKKPCEKQSWWPILRCPMLDPCLAALYLVHMVCMLRLLELLYLRIAHSNSVSFFFFFCLIQGPVQGSDDPEPEPDHLNTFNGVQSEVQRIG